MKKQTHIRLLTLLFLIVCFSACEKVDITQLYITIENQLPIFIAEDINIMVKEYAHREGKRANPKEYQWTVSDSSGNIVDDDFPNSNEVMWVSNEAGKFTVSVNVQYGLNASKSSSEEIIVEIDNRLPYTGDYHFMKVTRYWREAQESRYDTTYYDGFVKPDTNDKYAIEIKSGNSQIGQAYHEHFITTVFYKDDYEHPQFGRQGDHQYRLGFFVTHDSLVIRAADGGNGGGANWDYYGSKIK